MNKYYEINKDKVKERSNTYYYNHREEILEKRRTYRKIHKADIAKYKKDYYKNNKLKIQKYKKEYANKNKKYLANYFKEYQRFRRAADDLHRFKMQIRHLVWLSFNKNGEIKSKKTEEILGCDLDFFISYLLETYKKNYGVDYNNKEKVHIDHIIPLATAKTEEDIIKLCHYTNLQLLKAKDNLKKGAKKEKMQKIEEELI